MKKKPLEKELLAFFILSQMGLRESELLSIEKRLG
jgi:hypothetical protein